VLYDWYVTQEGDIHHKDKLRFISIFNNFFVTPNIIKLSLSWMYDFFRPNFWDFFLIFGLDFLGCMKTVLSGQSPSTIGHYH